LTVSLVAPPAFRKACKYLGQNFAYEPADLAVLVETALMEIEPRERAEIKAFLDRALDGRYDSATLQDMWWSTPASITFRTDEQLRQFLELLRAEVSGVECFGSASAGHSPLVARRGLAAHRRGGLSDRRGEEGGGGVRQGAVGNFTLPPLPFRRRAEVREGQL
jgi:hypothetical protein